MAGLGVAICYNMLGIRMYVVQPNNFGKAWTKKIESQHNLATSRSRMCMEAKQPYQNGKRYIQLKYWTGTWTYKLNENARNADIPGDVWDVNSDRTNQCRKLQLLVKATIYLVSIAPVWSVHDKPWQMSRNDAKAVNFMSNLTGYLTKVVRHMYIIIGRNILLSCCYPELCVW